MSFRLTVILLVLGSLAARGTHAQTSYPMLMSLHPVAAQQGQTSEHVIRSRYNLYGAFKVLVSGNGVHGDVVSHTAKEGEKTDNLESLKVRFTVLENAQPGVRDFRVATPRGVSTLGQLVITKSEVIVESGNNDSPVNAQPAQVPATLCGAIEKAEDVDYYKLTVVANTSLTFHVRSMRLQDRIHDLNL